MDFPEVRATSGPEGDAEEEAEEEVGMAAGAREESMERRMASWICISSGSNESPRNVMPSSSSEEM